MMNGGNYINMNIPNTLRAEAGAGSLNVKSVATGMATGGTGGASIRTISLFGL